MLINNFMTNMLKEKRPTGIQKTFNSDNEDIGDKFGKDIAISKSGDIAVIGAELEESYNNWGLKKSLYGANEDTDDAFGYSVAINETEDIIVVGAYSDDGTGDAIAAAGTAYVYYKDEGGVDNWGLKATLFGDNEDSGDRFGSSVAISGSTIVVGAYNDDGVGNLTVGAGAAYVFYKDEGGTDNWGLKKSLYATPANEDSSDYFGHSVAIDGTTIVVGANQDDGTGDLTSGAGTVYVYYKDEGGVDNWGHKKTLYGANEDTSDDFGWSVAIDGTTIVVGAKDDDGTGDAITDAGTVYVFYKDEGGTDNWGLKKTLVNGPNEDSSDAFGWSVSIDGTTIVVGAYLDDGSTNAIGSAGAAYVFHKDEGGADNWGLKASLYGNNEDVGDYFGYSVSIDGSTIVVGASQDDGTGDAVDAAGTVYVYYKDEGGTDNWGLHKTVVNGPNEDTFDSFGYSVAIKGSTIVVGAKDDDGSTDAISGAGSAYIFYEPEPDLSVSITDAGAVYIHYKDEGGVDNWGLKKKLYTDDSIINDKFGKSIAIDGTGSTIVAGAESRETTYDNWGLNKAIYAPSASENDNDQFGHSVAINETAGIIVVGANQDDGSTNAISGAGSAYIHYKDEGGVNNWGLKKSLFGPDEKTNDDFGKTVVINDIGDTVIVSSPKKDTYSLSLGLRKGIYGANEDSSDHFGASVAINETAGIIIIGAPEDDGSTNAISGAGSAYIFYKDEGGTDNWGLKKSLFGNNEDIDDAFGVSVAINDTGDIIVVGAWQDDGTGDAIDRAGTAYVYYKDEGGTDNWGLKKTLYGANEDAIDYFGYSVAIDGSTIVVGAYNDDGVGDLTGGAGTAYVYYKDEGGTDNWGLKASLFGDNEDGFDRFGFSVAIDGSTIVVGAEQDDGVGDLTGGAGTAYVFYKDEGGTDNWGLKASLFGDNEDGGDSFGTSVAIDGSTIVVGAEDDDGSTNAISAAGSAYVFYKDEGGTDNWGLKASLFGTNEDASDFFGSSVAIDGTTIVVGAYQDEGGAQSGAGVVYVYHKDEGGTDNWGLKTSLLADPLNEDANDNFGYSVAIDGSTIIAGAYQDDGSTDAITGAGSAYIYDNSTLTLDKTDVGEVYVYYKDEGGVDNWGLKATLSSPDQVDTDYFGWTGAIAIDGSTIVVGAYKDDGVENATTDAGAAYVFHKDEGGTDNWGHVKTLYSPNEDASDGFGISVAIKNSIIVVGAWYDEGLTNTIDKAGSAYVFYKDEGGTDNWGLKKSLYGTNEDEGDTDSFGYRAAINETGDIIVISARDDEGSTNEEDSAGTVYVFYKDEGGTDNWGLKKKLYSYQDNEDSNDDFGQSVAISGTTIVVGAALDEGSLGVTGGTGSAYVFDKDLGGTDNWGLKKSLYGDNEIDNFGYSVAIDGSTVIVGSYRDDGSTNAINNAGGAYIFEESILESVTTTDAGEAYVFYKDEGGTDNWGLKKTLSGLRKDTTDQFGYSVAINEAGDTIVVGANNDDGRNDANTDVGTAYIFQKDHGGTDNWGLIKILTRGRELASDGFGYSTAISGSTIVVSAYQGDSIETADIGAVYIFDKDEGGTDNWGHVKTLFSSNPVAGDEFGSSIAIDGDIIIVGAPKDHGVGDTTADAGEVYMYYRNEGGANNWGLKKLINSPSDVIDDYFGNSVAIAHNIMVIGAEGKGTGGVVYTYGRNSGGIDNWALISTITSDNDTAGDLFGHTVAVSKKLVFIGAPEDDGVGDATSNAGEAYIFGYH